MGMPVVLLVNLSLREGLCNGSQGVICGFAKYYPTGGNFQHELGRHDLVQEKEIDEFIEKNTGTRIRSWPVVAFHNGEVRTIYPYCSVIAQDNKEPYSLLMRTQIPLAPAWAMTIHKSQGMTLDRAIVDVSNPFESGQVYVGLSRVRELRGLKEILRVFFLRSRGIRKWSNFTKNGLVTWTILDSLHPNDPTG